MPTYTRLMRGALAALLTTAIAVSSHALFSMPAPMRQNAQPTSAQSGGTPVVVELFTSEGCSSCPFADRVLADLKHTQPVAGARIIVLSEHVDYWNYIGWNDPFSSAAYTARQQAYGRAFHLNGVYTPQAVVDGQAERVGSERQNLEQDIVRAARLPKATVQITPTSGSVGEVRVTVRGLSRSQSASGADVMLAITQDGMSSRVTRGENAGRTLSHVSVVRSLRSLGGTAGQDTFSALTRLDAGISSASGDREAVVFVQDRSTHHILGANTLKLAGN